jgi:hypothetical protein
MKLRQAEDAPIKKYLTGTGWAWGQLKPKIKKIK